MRSRILRAIGLAALVPMLALAVSGLRWNQFRCLMSGAVSEDRCCPASQGEPPATPVVAASECCQHEAVVVSRPVSEPPVAKQSPLPPAGAAMAVAVVLPPSAPALARNANAADPPRPKSPLVLRTHVLLI